MAKRFTATEKWNDPWFCRLEVSEKLFWIYLMDNCDHAGIWQVNWPLVKFHLGDFGFQKSHFEGRILELRPDKWFIPKFIDFQYGRLNSANRTHLSVLSILKKEGACKGLISPFQGAKDKDKDKDKDKGDGVEGVRSVLEHFNLVCRKALTLTPTRKTLIEQRLAAGRTLEEMKAAISNFAKDDWPERGNYLDLVYAIGIRNKIDNLDRWLDAREKTNGLAKTLEGPHG